LTDWYPTLGRRFLFFLQESRGRTCGVGRIRSGPFHGVDCILGIWHLCATRGWSLYRGWELCFSPGLGLRQQWRGDTLDQHWHINVWPGNKIWKVSGENFSEKLLSDVKILGEHWCANVHVMFLKTT
jgi:hypothetical protein